MARHPFCLSFCFKTPLPKIFARVNLFGYDKVPISRGCRCREVKMKIENESNRVQGIAKLSVRFVETRIYVLPRLSRDW